jgi:two-component system phosphate regulon sensor histidine kinase PhoR
MSEGSKGVSFKIEKRRNRCPPSLLPFCVVFPGLSSFPHFERDPHAPPQSACVRGAEVVCGTANSMTETKRILLVDDETRFRETSVRLLAARGFEVIGAENGQAALDILSKNSIDLILLDLKMPVMGGEECLRLARTSHPDVPVVIITGHGTLDTAVECMKKGAYDFVTKPFEMDQLLLTINRAIEKRNLEREKNRYQEETVRNLIDLNTEKKRLETIISCMANGVMVTNKHMEIILHNPALLRLLGISGDLTNPIALTQVLHDETLIEALKQIQSGEVPEKEFFSQEIHVGSKILRAISAPTLGPDRNVFWAVTGTVTVLEDVTAFKQLDQMKSDFLNMVAHELRSPLVSIRQLNSVLLEGLAGPLQEKQQDFVKRTMNKIDALLGLINDLLDVARLEAGRMVRQQAAVDVGKIIEEMVALMESRAREQRIVLSCSLKDLRPILADPKNIEEVLNNLLSNAINYSPDGGKVTVTARGVDQFIEIKVSDTGVGIPAEEIPKIFEKFYRVKHPKTRHIAGTGLGLSLVKGIVEAYHGSIGVESAPGKGTTFTIILPATRTED